MAKQKKNKRFPRVRRFVVTLFLGGNLFTLFLLWACCASTWIDPAQHPRISVIGLAFPVLMILNLLFLPLWLVFKPRLLVVPVVGMALCGGFILDYFPMNVGHGTHDASLRLMTWNCHEMLAYNGDSLKLATDYITESGADIICLQEYSYHLAKYKPMQDSMVARGYEVYHVGARSIFSRYPILSSLVVGVPTISKNSMNDVIRADVQRPDEVLTVYCVHLESNRISPDEKSEYANVIETPERIRVQNEVRFLSGKLSTAAQTRAQQVQRILENIDSLPDGRSVLICGDFNDTPISYAYQTFARQYGNVFRSRGRGVGVSFSEQYFPVRIDNIFFSTDWECTETYIDYSITASDHYPLHAGLKKRRD